MRASLVSSSVETDAALYKATFKAFYDYELKMVRLFKEAGLGGRARALLHERRPAPERDGARGRRLEAAAQGNEHAGGNVLRRHASALGLRAIHQNVEARLVICLLHVDIHCSRHLLELVPGLERAVRLAVLDDLLGGGRV